MNLSLGFGAVDQGALSPPASSATAPPRPRIGPVREGTARPFWSVMVPIYNCPPAYLRETLESVLVQDPGPEAMQIEVIDNCSTVGDPEAVVREVGGGRIAFRRQAENVGIVENFNSCIRDAVGHWVHILHGDDTVRPGFYRRLQAGIEANPDAGAATCRILYSDHDGQWIGISDLEARRPGLLPPDFVKRQMIDQRIQFAGIAVQRSVYEELGGFSPAFFHCLDWDMWKRIALRKAIFYEPEPLACYRLHDGADTGRAMRTGQNVVDERRSIDLSCAEVSPGEARQLRRAARRAAGVRAARRARSLWRAGERRIAWAQFREAARCSLAPPVSARLAYFLLRIVVR